MKALITIALLLWVSIPVHAQQPSWLGLSVEDGKDAGATVLRVDTGSPAEKAGLKSGDQIMEYNKAPVLGAIQFTRLVRETPAGRTVELRVRREGKDQTMQVTTGRLADAPGRTFRSYGDFGALRDRLDNMRRNMPSVQISTSFGRLWIRVNSMTAQLRDFFGVTGPEAGGALE